MNEKIKAFGENVSEQYVFFMSIKVYIEFIQEIWVHIYDYFWVQSLCLLGACLWLGWVQSMRLLGAKYAVVGCTYMDTIGCMYAAFGCMSMDRLGACLTVGSLPDSR